MPFNDIRGFIAKLEKECEAQRIEEEVDWNLEAGAMIRRANEVGLPSPFFQKVNDYPDGYRLFGEVLNNHRRIAIAMDMEPDTPVKELIEEYLKRKKSPITFWLNVECLRGKFGIPFSVASDQPYQAF